jgi:photoactive yellow protein
MRAAPPSIPGYDSTLIERDSAFDSPSLIGWLEAASPADLDRLPYGLIAMARDWTVMHYNRTESALSGLTPARLIGRPFFATVALCMDNALVAGRFERANELDSLVDYVFTFKVTPVKVRLRLLKSAGARQMYLAVMKRP